MGKSFSSLEELAIKAQKAAMQAENDSLSWVHPQMLV